MDTNRKLLELYESNIASINHVRAQCTEGMQGPFLIAPSEAYWSSPTRVAFVGQETFGWPSVPDIAGQMKRYANFNLGENYYSTPFWNVIRKMELALTGRNFNSAWLNLNRFDQKGRKPSFQNRVLLQELDFLLLDELRIIAPHIVIFFTGPHYDRRVSKTVGGTPEQVPGFELRQLCTMKGSVLSARVFRTYHPNYLRRSGLEAGVVAKVSSLAEDATHSSEQMPR